MIVEEMAGLELYFQGLGHYVKTQKMALTDSEDDGGHVE